MAYMRRGLVLVVSALLAVVLAEGLLHAVWTPPVRVPWGQGLFLPDDHYGWRPLPNLRGLDRNGAIVTTNRLGYRGRDHGAKTRPRVVVLGDSFGFGWRVHDGESYPERLESRLTDIDVVNLSVPAYSAAHYARLMARDVVAYEPDVILITITQNDITSVPIPPPVEPDDMTPEDPNVTYLDDLFRNALLAAPPLYRSAARIGLVAPLGGYTSLDDNLRPALRVPSPSDEAWASFFAHLETAHRLAGTTPLVIATIPARQALEPATFTASIATLTYRAQDFDLAWPYERIGAWCQERGIAYLNGHTALRGQTGLYLPHDLHFNARGHAAFAGALVDTLRHALQ
jgi:lysophospholipase L1-like esterase